MILNVWLNGKKISEEISADTLLIDFVRKHGCSSVKRGCDTSNCGLCTLLLKINLYYLALCSPLVLMASI